MTEFQGSRVPSICRTALAAVFLPFVILELQTTLVLLLCTEISGKSAVNLQLVIICGHLTQKLTIYFTFLISNHISKFAWCI